MNTELAARTGTVPEQMIASSPGDVLEAAVDRVLASVRPSTALDTLSTARPDAVSAAQQAEESLVNALRVTTTGADRALEQAVACAEAAAEHLRYGELQEARLLLVAARGNLVRSHTRRR